MDMYRWVVLSVALKRFSLLFLYFVLFSFSLHFPVTQFALSLSNSIILMHCFFEGTKKKMLKITNKQKHQTQRNIRQYTHTNKHPCIPGGTNEKIKKHWKHNQKRKERKEKQRNTTIESSSNNKNNNNKIYERKCNNVYECPSRAKHSPHLA